MELTFDHFIIILGILLGVGLTLLGVGFTEYIKNKREKKRLTTAFKNEVLSNLRKAEYNLNISKIKTKQSFPRQMFHTTAFEQLKLAIPIDWEKSELCNSIYRGFALVELYNLSINYPGQYKLRKDSKETYLENIKKEMQNIHDRLKKYKNIKNAVKAKPKLILKKSS